MILASHLSSRRFPEVEISVNEYKDCVPHRRENFSQPGMQPFLGAIAVQQLKNGKTSSVVLGSSERRAGHRKVHVHGETSVTPSPRAGTPKTGGLFVFCDGAAPSVTQAGASRVPGHTEGMGSPASPSAASPQAAIFTGGTLEVLWSGRHSPRRDRPNVNAEFQAFTEDE